MGVLEGDSPSEDTHPSEAVLIQKGNNNHTEESEREMLTSLHLVIIKAK